MLLVEVVTGDDVTPAAPEDAAAAVVPIDGGEAVQVESGQYMRELRWRVAADAVVSLVGTGDVLIADLVAAAASLSSSLRPKGPVTDGPVEPGTGTSDFSISAVGLPGQTEGNNNMRGSGSTYTDDWGVGDHEIPRLEG